MANLIGLSLKEIIGLVFTLIGVAILLSIIVKYFGFSITDLIP